MIVFNAKNKYPVNSGCSKLIKMSYFCIKDKDMQTVRLRISEKIYDRLLWLLSKFNKDEVEVIHESAEFVETKRHLEFELQEIQDGKAEFIEITEADNRLEEIIKKNEDTV